MDENLKAPRAVIVGSGFAGLCLAHHLRQAGIPFTILEKADRLGGTWRDNIYPGAACDVPSMSYCFSFAQKTDWSRKWSPQEEILDYLEDCADRLGIRPHIRFDTEVAGARFDETRGAWKIRTTDGEEIEAEIFVSAVGQLHRPSIPQIPGRDDFRGPAFHSARWRRDVELAGKRVAVVGNAASAIQFVPEIAKTAGKVLVFQRSANWMIPRNDRAFTDAERRRFARRPWLARLVRWLTWASYETMWPTFAGNRFTARLQRRIAETYLAETIPDPAMRRVLTPEYPIGAKRILISDDYYAALTRDNVELITAGIERMTTDGLVTSDGVKHEADVVIFATGFRTTEFLVPMEIEGRDGRSLNDAWREGAEAYLGMTVAGFSNFFMMYGPNTNLGHNSIIFMIECQAGYIIDCLRKMREAGATQIDVTPETMRAYNDELQATLRNRVWARVDHSWYKNEAGRITNNWSGSTIEYWRRTRKADLSKYRLIRADVSAQDGSETATATGAAERSAA